MSQGLTEILVFLARETHLTKAEIEAIPLEALPDIIDELKFQKAMDEYREASNAALIAATLVNLFSKKRTSIVDLIGPAPQRKKKKLKEEAKSIWQLAKEAGIRTPSRL
jgi:hypothetical protein